MGTFEDSLNSYRRAQIKYYRALESLSDSIKRLECFTEQEVKFTEKVRDTKVQQRPEQENMHKE